MGEDAMMEERPAAAPAPGRRGRESLRVVLSRFLGLAGAAVFSQLIGFAALAYVTRKIGTANLGAYTFAATLTSYAGLIANAGVATKATRDIARDPETAEAAVREAVTLQCILAVGVYLLLLALSPLVPTRAARDMLPIVAILPLLSAITLDWPLLSIGRARPVGVWRSIGQVAYAIPVPILVGTGLGGGLRYAGLNMFGLAVTACGMFFSFRRVMRHSWEWPTFRALVKRLRDSVAFGAVQVLLVVMGGIGPLMLGYLASDRAVGLFAVAYKIPNALVALTQTWLNAFFPHAARELRADPDGFADQLGRVLSFAIVLLLTIAAGSALCAGRLMPDLFGAKFSSAATPFALLSVSAGLVVVQACVTEGVLMSLESQRYYVTMLCIALPLMLAVQGVLISQFGVDGAAAAAIVADLYLAIGGAIGVSRKLGTIRVNLPIIARGVLAVLVMSAVMFATRPVGLVPQMASGGIVLLVAAWMSGLLKKPQPAAG